MPWQGALMWSYLAFLSQMAIFPGLVLYFSYIPENMGVNKKCLNKNDIPIRNKGIFIFILFIYIISIYPI